MDNLIKRLRTACSPESPLGKLCTEAANELEKYINELQKVDDFKKFSELQKQFNSEPIKKEYICPICNLLGENRYLTCQRPNCTDGRDER